MKTIPALSIQTPWANQILRLSHRPGLALKWCENRTWPTQYRGPLLIHRSGPGGAILGEVRLLDVIDNYGTEEEDCHQALRRLRRTVRQIYGAAGFPPPTTWDYAEPFSGYWWLLADPLRYAHPVECGGRLRLWQPPPAVWRRVRSARALSLGEPATSPVDVSPRDARP